MAEGWQGWDDYAPFYDWENAQTLARRDVALLLRGDIRHLPFRRRARFAMVMAPYGMLQSLTRERDLLATLTAVHGVLPRGGLFAIDLVPDLPRWAEYDRRVSLSGRRGVGAIRLTESVRQDRRQGLTI